MTNFDVNDYQIMKQCDLATNDSQSARASIRHN